MHVAPAGDQAVLVDLGEVSAAELHAAARAVSAVPGVQACVVGHSSLYVVESPGLRVGESARGSVIEAIQSSRLSSATRRPDDSPARIVPVAFANAPDLAEFLAHANLTMDAFLARVAALRLTVRYLGFRGGFGYLDGWPEEWAMPRRPTSRPVARGSFAIAGNVAGFYPIDTPGGWNVLGHTNEDLEYALTPGDTLAIDPSLSVATAALGRRELARRNPTAEAAVATQKQCFEIISAPFLTVVRDADYTLLARGAPAGGPFDELAAALAKRAVRECEVLFECAMTGPRLQFREDAVASWCGPDLAVRVERVRAGAERALGRITGGLRGYLAIGREEGATARVARDDRFVIRVKFGPHDVGLGDLECEVTPQLDRVGIRLRPLRALNVEIPADLRSCGMQFGTVQLHPDGSMVAMGPDHPVTGGYLQPMTVLTAERWKLGQLMPGDKVTFAVT